MRRYLIVAVVAGVTAGCGHTAEYRTTYVMSHIRHFQPTIQGEALVVTEPTQDEKIYSAHPSSLTGFAMSFDAKAGYFLREIMVKVLSYQFIGGAQHASVLPQDAHAYRVIVKPILNTFDYRYNQLKNLGLAITPEAKVVVHVSVLDSQGQLLLDRQYESGFVSGGSYVVDFQPAEKINHALHRALTEIANQVAQDIEAALRPKS